MTLPHAILFIATLLILFLVEHTMMVKEDLMDGMRSKNNNYYDSLKE